MSEGPRKVEELTAAVAQKRLAEWVEQLAAQHMRLKLGKSLVEGGELTKKHLHKDARAYEGDKPLGNLLQEQPEDVDVTLFWMEEGELRARTLVGSPVGSVADVFGSMERRVGAWVQGRTAALALLHDPEFGTWMRRIAQEPPPKPPAPKKGRTRATAAKRPASKRTPKSPSRTRKPR